MARSKAEYSHRCLAGSKYCRNYKITIQEKSEHPIESSLKLFFVNLGGYRPGEFEEDHYKMLIVAKNPSAAIRASKKSIFFKTNGYKGAPTHIDDTYVLDADDVYELKDILPAGFNDNYELIISEKKGLEEDKINQGYLQLWRIK